MKQTFINIGWAVLEESLFLIAFGLILSIQFGLLHILGIHPLDYITLNNISESTNPFPLLWYNYLPVLLAFITASLVTHHFIFHRPVLTLGYIRSNSSRLFAKGWAWSMVMVIPGFILLWAGRYLTDLSSSLHWSFIFGFFLFFLIQSAGEEILTRAFLIPMLEYRLGTWVALLLSASLFALMHIGNDNFTWLGFINILLGGWIMALLFVIYRNIMVCIGYHAGWNFVQAGFFDFNVSGVDVHSMIQFQENGHPMITGGLFGYEGSFIPVLLQSLLFFYLIKNYKIIIKPPRRANLEPGTHLQLPMESRIP